MKQVLGETGIFTNGGGCCSIRLFPRNNYRNYLKNVIPHFNLFTSLCCVLVLIGSLELRHQNFILWHAGVNICYVCVMFIEIVLTRETSSFLDVFCRSLHVNVRFSVYVRRQFTVHLSLLAVSLVVGLSFHDAQL